MTGADIIAIIILLAIIIAVVVYLLHWLYRRSSKDISFVRTGYGGEKVVMGGGALVLPIVHQVTEVSMNTLRLEVKRVRERSLITKDHMRVEVGTEFYVRVIPSEQAVSIAARTLGSRTMDPESLKELVEGRFTNAMSVVAAQMSLKEMHEHRGDYIKKVGAEVHDALVANGLELENASLTFLDQTDIKLFNPANTFDADGLTTLTEQIEKQRKKRNDTEQDTMVSIRNKNLEAQQRALEIDRDLEFARLEQEREVATRRSVQKMEIALERIQRERETEEAEIKAKEEVERARIAQTRTVAVERIAQELEVERQEVQRRRTIEIDEMEKAIALILKHKEENEAKAQAEDSRARTVAAAEKVNSVREMEMAERRKMVELVDARQKAEREAIQLTVVAAAQKEAAELRSGAAEYETKAQRLRNDTEADGRRALHEAENALSDESRKWTLHMKLVDHLEGIIRESVKPMEQIESIKLLHVDGLPGLSGGAPHSARGPDWGVQALNGDDGSGGGSALGGAGGGGSLADQIVSSAMRYRAQAPLVDSLLQEIGLNPRAMTQLGTLLDADARGKGASPSPVGERS